MKPKTVGWLAGLAILAIAGAAFLNQQPSAISTTKAGEAVFPELVNRLNDVAEVALVSNKETVTVGRDGETWAVREKDNYPAALNQLKPLLIGLAELKYREQKTKNPDLHAKLGLQEPTADGAPSTLITIQGNDQTELASLLIGNQRPAKGSPSLSEIYIRKPGDPQTWLAVGKLRVEKTIGNWLEKDLYNVVAKRIQRATVTHPSGETLVVYKNTPDALDFIIQDLPGGSKVTSQFNVNNVATTLGQLSMEDVRKQTDADQSLERGVQATLETFDGLRITVDTRQSGETILATMSAAFDETLVYQTSERESPPTSPAMDGPQSEGATAETAAAPKTDTVLNTPEDVQAEAIALNQKVAGWIFELPKFRVDNFAKTARDFLEGT